MSDPSSPEIQRFEPLPAPRHYWSAPYESGPAGGAGPEDTTPERWFEPGLPPAPSPERPPTNEPNAGISRGVVALVLATSLIAALVGAGGTYAVLQVSGALNRATPAPAAGPVVSVQSEESTIIAAVNRVEPAVVQIVTSGGAGGTAVGSGVIYDSGGWILTNRHVVEGATSLLVQLQDGRQLAGTIYGLDTLTDLAIVKIDAGSSLAVAPVGDSSSLQVGQLAIAIGSPLGQQYANSATSGIVSALGRDISITGNAAAATTNLHGLIQTDAAINPGDSGGPLIDATGKVIGIATAQAQIAQGIGFAIPINVAKPIMQQALAGEKLSRPFIGVSYDAIDKGLQQQYKLPLSQGAWVHNEDASGNSIEAVVAGSPGANAGIKTGDIITKVEGQAVDSTHELEDLLVQYAPGRTVSLEVYRGGSYLTLMVTLGTRPDSTS
ncbi:MAG: S1C family serine protease [Candidatus Limnocylindrales bacterium]